MNCFSLVPAEIKAAIAQWLPASDLGRLALTGRPHTEEGEITIAGVAQTILRKFQGFYHLPYRDAERLMSHLQVAPPIYHVEAAPYPAVVPIDLDLIPLALNSKGRRCAIENGRLTILPHHYSPKGKSQSIPFRNHPQSPLPKSLYQACTQDPAGLTLYGSRVVTWSEFFWVIFQLDETDYYTAVRGGREQPDFFIDNVQLSDNPDCFAILSTESSSCDDFVHLFSSNHDSQFKNYGFELRCDGGAFLMMREREVNDVFETTLNSLPSEELQVTYHCSLFAFAPDHRIAIADGSHPPNINIVGAESKPVTITIFDATGTQRLSSIAIDSNRFDTVWVMKFAPGSSFLLVSGLDCGPALAKRRGVVPANLIVISSAGSTTYYNIQAEGIGANRERGLELSEIHCIASDGTVLFYSDSTNERDEWMVVRTDINATIQSLLPA